MISIRNVSKSFNGFEAVRGLSLEVPRGEIFGLVGPNGAGKTTTIRMMTGLASPTGGSVSMDGHDLRDNPVEAKRVTGYIPDRSFFYEKLTPVEFLFFVASIYAIDKKTAKERAENLLSEFGLIDRAGDFIEGYSQGMRQRLLFASALIHEPKVLVIDEPFVGLDPFGVVLLTEKIEALSKAGAALFLATHSLHIAGKLCHRVGLMEQGSITTLKMRDELSGHEGGLEGFFLSTARREITGG